MTSVPSNGKRAVVLTTDCGTEMDDQWAIAHLVLSPELDLRGIVTNHAPNIAAPAAETAAGFVREVLDHVKPPERPLVIAGASGPLADGRTPSLNPGVEFILEQARERTADDRLTVLTIGTATDVASTILVDPSVTERIEVGSMGYDAWPDGGDRWNVHNDIPAWQTLMASEVPLAVGDAAVCIKRLTLSEEGGKARLEGCGAAGEYLARLLSDWLVAYLLGLTTSELYPRPRVRDDKTFDHEAGGNGQQIRWITDLDTDALWEDLRRKLQGNM